MKIFYCKRCIANNKNKLLNTNAYISSMSYTPTSQTKTLSDYKGITFKNKELSVKCPICQTEMIDTNINDIKEFCDIIEYGNYSADFLLAMIELKKNDIIKYTNQMNSIHAKAEEELDPRYTD